jgi:flagellar basal-body rod modification protein FlgD
MIDVSQLTNSDAVAPGVSSAAKKDTLGQGAFLELMVTQLKNQDPFKPVDPSAFLGQLAQFGTVTGIQEMQSSISTLADSLRSSQVLDGTSLVGHEVIAAGNKATLGATGDVDGLVDLPEGVSAAAIAITDAAGTLVRRMQLPAQQGSYEFTWDGKADNGSRAPAGNYTIQAIANVGGANQQLEMQLASKVGSVTIDPTNHGLTLNTNIGPIALADVRRVM